ncbi:MAG: D-tyrosyl-tRNA(Tyr) deacylase [Lachnospiraceae bacterium]|nr:D-tyrosyl-tRNA(Tyr) deacylase [Lachnospiraceae bacterium]
MRFVIQRVSHASVTIDENVRGKIEKGYMVLIGIGQEDDEKTADKLVQKMINLRIFEDANGKTNLALKDVNGGLLLISQFTLYADCKKGNRPSFVKAGAPDRACALYEYIKRKCAENVENVQCGEFGADMKVELLNDGPFTVILDSEWL